MTSAIMQQVSEKVKKTVEATSSVRPLPRFEYVPTMGCKPSHRCDPMVSPRRSERMQEAPHTSEYRRSREENSSHSIGANEHLTHHSSHGHPAKSTTASTSPRGLKERSPNDDGRQSIIPIVSVPEVPLGKARPAASSHAEKTASMTSAPKPQNMRKYYEFHEQNGHTIAECWELRKPLHELADKGGVCSSYERNASQHGQNHKTKNAPSR
ncbi:hypothetical protein Cgig2_011079 [Carnegiea gigantea]|uniref:Uncharacterized protein n=1 Tax=Carnegiea gigantea TaxID=171969 RepID=A0A9Q1JSJ4_9CARY|nr:hypothetical protein Cgig2_011079 [Carnegiea gigantea]